MIDVIACYIKEGRNIKTDGYINVGQINWIGDYSKEFIDGTFRNVRKVQMSSGYACFVLVKDLDRYMNKS
ncbi:MAG: hypothetical protein CMK59_00335 [Proteobacteria bacterium]|nr:hypothetical protein [Pseudomonadota bacterium]